MRPKSAPDRERSRHRSRQHCRQHCRTNRPGYGRWNGCPRGCRCPKAYRVVRLGCSQMGVSLTCIFAALATALASPLPSRWPARRVTEGTFATSITTTRCGFSAPQMPGLAARTSGRQNLRTSQANALRFATQAKQYKLHTANQPRGTRVRRSQPAWAHQRILQQYPTSASTVATQPPPGTNILSLPTFSCRIFPDLTTDTG